MLSFISGKAAPSLRVKYAVCQPASHLNTDADGQAVTFGGRRWPSSHRLNSLLRQTAFMFRALTRLHIQSKNQRYWWAEPTLPEISLFLQLLAMKTLPPYLPPRVPCCTAQNDCSIRLFSRKAGCGFQKCEVWRSC